MATDQISSLWSYLRDNSLTDLNESDFRSKMQDKGQRESLHKFMSDKSNGLTDLSFGDFDYKLGTRNMTALEQLGDWAGKAKQIGNDVVNNAGQVASDVVAGAGIAANKVGEFFNPTQPDRPLLSLAPTPAPDNPLVALGKTLYNVPGQAQKVIGGNISLAGDALGNTNTDQLNTESQAGLNVIQPKEGNSIQQFGQQNVDYGNRNILPINKSRDGSLTNAISGFDKYSPTIAAFGINPILGISTLGANTASDVYEQTGNPGYAMLSGAGQSLVGLATMPLTEAMPLLKPETGVLSKIAGGAITGETVNKFSQAVQIGVDKGTINPNMTLGEAWDRFKQNNGEGAFVGGVLGALAPQVTYEPYYRYPIYNPKYNEITGEVNPPSTAMVRTSKTGKEVIYVDQNGSPVETRTGGTPSWRNNNIGNIEYGDFAKSHGAIGTDGRFAIFKTLQDGMFAADALLRSPSYSGLTIAQMARRWSPEGNEAQAKIEAFKSAGFDVNGKYVDLSDKERSRFLKTKQQIEGYKAGDIVSQSPEQSVATKIATGQPVTLDDQQTYANAPNAVEEELQSMREQNAVNNMMVYDEVQKAKEPWQMTKDEFDDHWIKSARQGIRKEVDDTIGKLNLQKSELTAALNSDKNNPANQAIRQEIDSVDSQIKEQESRLDVKLVKPSEFMTDAQMRFHQGIDNAISEGKPVPPEVLADYPDLQQKAQEVGSPGAAKSTEVSNNWKERSYMGRVLDSPDVTPEVKTKVGQTGEVWYQPVSHMQTEEEALQFAGRKNPVSIANLAMDKNVPMTPNVRLKLADTAARRLKTLSAQKRVAGDIASADKLDDLETQVRTFIGKEGTELGRAIEIFKTFDPLNPDKMLADLSDAADDGKKQVQQQVTKITDALNESDGNTIETVAESEPVKKAVKKIVDKAQKEGVTRKTPEERSIWDQYVAWFGKSMDFALREGADPKQRGALQQFAQNVRKLFLQKLPVPVRAASPKWTAIDTVRTQIANQQKIQEAWTKAREQALSKNPDAEALSLEIPEELDAPFTTPDIKKVMRDMGWYNAKNIAKTWGADRSQMTQAIVEALMQDQPITPEQHVEISGALKKTIDGIIDAEKARMAETQQRLMRVREARQVARNSVREASKGGDIGARYREQAATRLANKLNQIYKNPVGPDQAPIKELMNDVVDALRQQLPSEPTVKPEQNVWDDYNSIKNALINRETYADVWERARAMARDKFPDRAGQIDKLFDQIDTQMPMNSVRRSLAEEMKAAGVDLKNVIREHYSTIDKTGQALGDRIAYRMGLNPGDAKELANIISAEFNRQAAVARARALANLAKRKVIARGTQKDLTEKLADYANLGALNDQHIYDIIAPRLGLPTFTPETSGTIKRLSQELQALREQNGPYGFTPEFFAKMHELEKFLIAQTPTNMLKLYTGLVTRINMLTSVKAWLTNIIGNTSLGNTEAIVRRISEAIYTGGKNFGGLNPEERMAYIKYAVECYDKSKYDPSRMISIEVDENNVENIKPGLQAEFKTLGEQNTNAEGKGTARKLIRFGQDVVFTKMQGKPDVIYAAIHFADAADMYSTTYAKTHFGNLTGDALKKKALEIMRDACRVEPLTVAGMEVRALACKDALRATLTDNSRVAQFVLKLRSSLDHIKIAKNLSIGELNIPFAKTPANVFMRGIEYSGLLAPFDAVTLLDGMGYNKNKEVDPDKVRKGIRGLVTAGFGMLAGIILGSLVDEDNYTGEYFMYSPSQHQLFKAQGRAYNSIKVGNVYISLDYFGALMAPTVGVLFAKKFAKNNPAAWPLAYAVGVAKQASHIPGFDQFSNAIGWVVTKEDEETWLNKTMKGIATTTVDFISSRTTSAILNDIGNASDKYERQIDYSSPYSALQGVQSQIPGVRELLDPRIDFFGEPIETQPGVSRIAFGARVKIGRNSEILNELGRLNIASELPSLVQIESTRKKMQALRERIGPTRFNALVISAGKNFNRNAVMLMNSGGYLDMPDDMKKSAWNSMRHSAVFEAFQDYPEALIGK